MDGLPATANLNTLRNLKCAERVTLYAQRFLPMLAAARRADKNNPAKWASRHCQLHLKSGRVNLGYYSF